MIKHPAINKIVDDGSRRLLVGSTVLLLALLWGVVALMIIVERNEAERGAYKDADNFARIFQEQSARTIQSVDQTVRFVKRAAEAQGKSFDLNGFLGEDITRDGLVNLVSLMDEFGNIVQSTQPFAPGNYLDREHIAVHARNDSGQVFISKPLLGRVSGKWSIQLTRRINKADGHFGGVLVVSMDPFFFTRLYHDIDIGALGAIALIADDGVVLARRSGGKDSTGDNIRGSQVYQAMRLTANGTLRATSVIDDSNRFFAFRRLDGYPLVAAVGLGSQEAMKPFYEYSNTVLTAAGLITIAILIMAAVLGRMVSHLQASRSRAIEANAAKSRFLSNMSHELRTPLNGILGYAELLESDLDGTPQFEFAQAISHSGEHLLSLVNSLLDLAKVEEGKMALQLAAQDVAEVVRSTLEGHLASAMKKGLELNFSIEPSLPRRSLIDRMRLVQVLNNLVHNAIKFTDQGAVKVTAAMGKDEVRFEIADSGPGIDPSMHEAVFEKFVQVDGSESRSHEGTGLGLALVRELVALMGGRIWVESALGKGSCFKFTMPIRAA